MQERYRELEHDTPDILVEHSDPCSWSHASSVGGDVLHVGRTMTEAAFLDPQSVECCARVQEVWVPTAFHAHVFVTAGVPHHKVFVFPQPVHATFILYIYIFSRGFLGVFFFHRCS